MVVTSRLCTLSFHEHYCIDAIRGMWSQSRGSMRRLGDPVHVHGTWPRLNQHADIYIVMEELRGVHHDMPQAGRLTMRCVRAGHQGLAGMAPLQGLRRRAHCQGCTQQQRAASQYGLRTGTVGASLRYHTQPTITAGGRRAHKGDVCPLPHLWTTQYLHFCNVQLCIQVNTGVLYPHVLRGTLLCLGHP
jgi:hypothetical protein